MKMVRTGKLRWVSSLLQRLWIIAGNISESSSKYRQVHSSAYCPPKKKCLSIEKKYHFNISTSLALLVSKVLRLVSPLCFSFLTRCTLLWDTRGVENKSRMRGRKKKVSKDVAFFSQHHIECRWIRIKIQSRTKQHNIRDWIKRLSLFITVSFVNFWFCVFEVQRKKRSSLFFIRTYETVVDKIDSLLGEVEAVVLVWTQQNDEIQRRKK